MGKLIYLQNPTCTKKNIPNLKVNNFGKSGTHRSKYKVLVDKLGVNCY